MARKAEPTAPQRECPIPYRARYRDKSTGKEYAGHFVKRSDAQEWLDPKTASMVSGNHADPRAGREPFRTFAEAWAAAQDWKVTSAESFPYVLARIETVLPRNASIGQIDQLAIKHARAALAKKYAPATVDLTVGYLAAIMRAAFANHRISADPTVGTTSRRRRDPKDHKVGPDDVPSRAEVTAIWNAAPGPYRAAIALGACGLRIGEVLGLTADRIDLESRLVTIDRQLQRFEGRVDFTRPKGEKARTIGVPAAVALELRRHLREYVAGAGALLFTGAGGAPTLRRDRFYLSAWRPALAGAGLGTSAYKFHSLRHFCASALLASGTNPAAVAGHLGDGLEVTLRVYSHWLQEDRAVAADALEAILGPVSENLADSSRTGTAFDG